MKKALTLTSLAGLAVMAFASSAAAQHGHGVYQTMKNLDRETDRLKSQYTRFMNCDRVARTDRRYLDLECAIKTFEREADHIRSDFENRRGFHEIHREVMSAKRAADRANCLINGGLRIPSCITREFCAAKCSLDKLVAFYCGRGGHFSRGTVHDHRHRQPVREVYQRPVHRSFEATLNRHGRSDSFRRGSSCGSRSGGFTIRFGH